MKVTEERGDDVEVRTVHVEALDARGETVARRSLQINEDLWGGGFVAAMQVDDDPALEVVAWGAHESDEDRFYLDYADGVVTILPFSQASGEARALAIERHQVQAGNRAGVVVLVVLAFFYYAALGLAWVVVRVVTSIRRRTASPVSQGDNT